MTITTLPLVAMRLNDNDPLPWYPFHSDHGGNLLASCPELPGPGFTWARDDEVESEHIALTCATLAELLFCSPLDPADHPSPAEIWRAVEQQLAACHCDLTPCLLRLAGEAGDHPHETAARMAWCLELAAIVTHPFQGA